MHQLPLAAPSSRQTVVETACLVLGPSNDNEPDPSASASFEAEVTFGDVAHCSELAR
jgi:hypothetical protein